MSFELELSQLRTQGLTFQDCVSQFAVPAYENPFVSKAREKQVKGQSEVDEQAPILIEEKGAFVLSWMWISNREAGVIIISELVDHILTAAKNVLAQVKTPTESIVENYQHNQQRAYVMWLDSLTIEKKELLNTVEKVFVGSNVPQVCEFTVAEQSFVFYPTQALMVLNSLALMGGFSLQHHLETQKFLLSNEQSINIALSPRVSLVNSVQ